MATEPRRRRAKWTHCYHLLGRSDILALQETHSTPANTARLLLPHTHAFWWSHDTQHTGGVAVGVSKSFLARFGQGVPGQGAEWVEIAPGRVAILRLEGPRGRLDMVVLYLHTGNARKDRDSLRHQLLPHLRPPNEVLTLIIGDWNFVTTQTDRMGFAEAKWTDGTDGDEHKDWRKELLDPLSLHEVWQEEMTHQTTLGSSRLDRAYANFHIAEQLYAGWSTTPLPWCKSLSTHRPILVIRCTDTSNANGKRTLSQFAALSKEWPRRVITLHLNLLHQEGGDTNRFRTTLLLKRAMATATSIVDAERQAKSHEGMGQTELTTAQKLSTLVAYLRANHEGKFWRLRHLQAKVAKALDNPPEGGGLEGMDILRQIKHRIVELAKQDIREEWKALKKEDTGEDDPLQDRTRQGIMRKLAKLKPGGATQIRAIQGPGGTTLTDPAEMAQALASYWRPTFEAKPIDAADLRAWIQELKQQGKLPNICPSRRDRDRWRIREQDVRWAIKVCKRSAPGPDGVGAAHWKALGRYGVKTLFRAAQAMEQEAAAREIPDAFTDEGAGHNLYNRGTLCCIPKGSGEATEAGGRAWPPASTRPLSIVDMDNRIIALAFRRRWEGPINRWVSQEQRGFLPKRSMLANVVQMEAKAISVAARHEQGAAALIDFKAAFPSISHEYLITCLRAVGLPSSAIRVIQRLYQDGHCEISVGGGLWPGFPMESGIRQGCPLSPMLFAVVMDVLLRAIPGELARETYHWAFADDVGVVMSNVAHQLPALQRLLDRFGRISGMEVNVAKTVLIPLWPSSAEEHRAAVTSAVPAWHDIQIDTSAIYLGVRIGPGKEDREWETAALRLQAKLRGWQWNQVGLHFAATIYNIYVQSTLGFTAQVADHTGAIRQLEQGALRKAAPGPGGWIRPEELWHLKAFGLPYEFKSTAITARAAKLRVNANENRRHGGLDCAGLHEQVAQHIRDLHFPARLYWLTNWHNRAVHTVIWEEVKRARQEGIETRTLILKGAPGNTVDDKKKRSENRRQLQAAVTKMLKAKDRYQPLTRARAKLTRWKLDRPERVIGDRFLRFMQHLKAGTTPRVQAAVMKTAWNAWGTARRFQVRHSPANRCMLGCEDHSAGDSLEHYDYCKVVKQLHESVGGTRADRRIPLWTGTASSQKYRHQANLKDAKSAYATFITTNAARRQGGITPKEAEVIFYDAFEQASSQQEKQGDHKGAKRGRRRTAKRKTGTLGARPGSGRCRGDGPPARKSARRQDRDDGTQLRGTGTGGRPACGLQPPLPEAAHGGA